jgi:hypothetical protein
MDYGPAELEIIIKEAFESVFSTEPWGRNVTEILSNFNYKFKEHSKKADDEYHSLSKSNKDSYYHYKAVIEEFIKEHPEVEI